MAKVYLSSNDSFILSSLAPVYGAEGSEKLIADTGSAGVVADQNIERIELPGASSSYSFQQTGNQLRIYQGSTLFATLTIQDDSDGTLLVFSNGAVAVKISNAGMTLGGSSVPASAASPVTPLTLDTGTLSTAKQGQSAGQKFTLTSATDTLVLTQGNDTIDGASVANSISGDVIVDSSSTDNDIATLKLTQTPARPTISHVETIDVAFEGFNVVFDATTVDHSTIKVSTTTDSQTKASLTGLNTNQVNVDVSTGISNLVLDSLANGTGSSTVKLAGGALTLSASANHLATLGLNSAGSSANTVTLTHNPGALEISGNQNLTLAGALANFSGDTLTNGLSSGATLTLKNTSTLATAVNLSQVTVRLYDLSADSGGQTVTLMAGTTDLTLNDSKAHAATFTANGSASNDVLNVSAKQTYGAGAFKTVGYETVKITDSTNTAQTLTSADFGAANVSISNPQSYTFAGSLVAGNLDASGLSGSATLSVSDFSNGSATSSTLIGTNNNDVIVVDNNPGEFITVDAKEGANSISVKSASDTSNMLFKTGAGADTLTGGGGNDNFISGAGADSITMGAGNDLVFAEAGDDNIIAGINLTATDTLQGGDGTDTLTVSDDTASTDLDNVSSFETLTLALTGNAAWVTRDRLIASGATLTVTQTNNFSLNLDASAETDGKLSVTANGSSAHTVIGGAGADTITMAASATGANKITGGGGADTIALGGSNSGVVYLINPTDSTVSSYDTITGFHSGFDTINLSATNLNQTFTIAANVTAAAGVTNGIATGKFTFDKAAATSLADAISRVGQDVKTSGNAVVFTYSSNVYFFADMDNTTATSSDILIKLTGATMTDLIATGEAFAMAL
ncbi:hypothetical protein BXU06_15795 [Aquaspirillum sp. LM1]|nr:hypothetical protein BXU06_15795 [Aquaspirillum sp. LM1]